MEAPIGSRGFFGAAGAECLDLTLQLAALSFDPVFRGRGVPHGHGEPVLLIPGFIASDVMLYPLAQWLSRIFYRPFFSGIIMNIDCPAKTMIEKIVPRLTEIKRISGRKSIVIGHSLGGTIGRAVALMRPDLVHHEISLGSPVRDGWDGVQDEMRFVLRGAQHLFKKLCRLPKICGTEECQCFSVLFSAASTNVEGRFTAIYSKSDPVVRWEACRITDGANYEVEGRHAGLIFRPQVYRILGEVLARATRNDVHPAHA